MRKLSIEEIQSIEDRLDKMSISYLEIYNELLDHYTTTLEQVSSDKFASTKEVLDEEFTWSVVRRMDKELLNSVSTQLQKSQLELLKFWKLNFWKVLSIFSYTSLLLVVYHFFGMDEMKVIAMVPACFIQAALLYYFGNYFGFPLDPNYYRPRKVIIQAVFGKSSLVFGIYILFLNFSFILSNHDFQNWAMALTIIFITAYNLSILTLYTLIYRKTFKVVKA
jgi:hypothetical protein